MGKKSTKNSSKQEKSQQIHSLVKILRPKVYITDTSNFKKLVQQLTGKGENDSSPVSSPPSYNAVAPFPDHDDLLEEDLYYNSVMCLSSAPSGFGSPDSLRPGNIDFSWQYRQLESALMGSSHNYDACDDGYGYGYGITNAYDHYYSDLSAFIM